jgi:hypothetical protein
MNLSGSPVLLVPRALAASWHGFYVSAEPDDDLPDLELADGTSWQIDDTFDFDRPRTDYDRLCAMLHEDPCLVSIDNGHGVAFGPGHDLLGWCDEHQEIVAGVTPESRGGLVWQYQFTWRNPGPELLLMNSCRHGADPDGSDGECFMVNLAPGLYEVATATSPGPWAGTLCRFQSKQA